MTLKKNEPLNMLIRYTLTDYAPGQTLKLVGKSGIVFKEETVVIGEDSIAHAQLVVHGEDLGFKISDASKVMPFGVFSTKNTVSADQFEWLK